MSKRVGFYLKEHSVTDDDSVCIVVDMDGLDNPEEVNNWIGTRVKLGAKIVIWDVLAIIFYVLNANRKKKKK